MGYPPTADITFNPCPTAQFYRVEALQSGGQVVGTATASSSPARWNNPGVYTFRVTAVDSNNAESDPSVESDPMLAGQLGSPVLRDVAEGLGKVTVTWKPSPDIVNCWWVPQRACAPAAAGVRTRQASRLGPPRRTVCVLHAHHD